MASTIQLKIKDQPLIVRQAELSEIIDLRHRVLRAGLPLSQAIFPGDELPTSSHYGAFADAALCCATFHLNSWQDQPAYQLRGMATHPAWAGLGLGRAVQKVAIETIIASSPIRLFWCNARLIAIPFYQKLGWKIVSELFDIPTAGPHYRMVFNSDGPTPGQ